VFVSCVVVAAVQVVEGAVLPQDAVLQGGLDLFCSLDCERQYYMTNSSSECCSRGSACSQQLALTFGKNSTALLQ
jgi:hypothetical protein